MIVEYSSNNSGGSFWLDEKDWKALERAGWVRDTDHIYRATREGLTLREAIEEFESVTGQYSNALGCNCCGPPHNFTFEGDNGEYEYYSPSQPRYGEPYW